MKTRLTAFVSALLLVFVTIRCKKGNDCVPPSLTVSNNAVLYEGEILNLTASSDDGAVFSWTGPNNFTSNEQNPSIANVTAAAAGDYTVKSIVGECEKEKTIKVDVLPKPTCSPANNTISLVTSLTFTNVSFGLSASGRYELDGTGSQGDVTIEFFTDVIAKGSFVYDLSTTDRNSNNASMQVDIGGVYSNWQATDGKLYVSIAVNKITATFCSATFGNIQGAPAQHGSGKVSCSY